MIEFNLSSWVAIPAALLLTLAGLSTLIGAIGLLRLRDFYSRMHPPTLGTTLGLGCVLLASMLVSSALSHRLVVHELLIAFFLVISAPVTTMLLARAAVTRKRDAQSEHQHDAAAHSNIEKSGAKTSDVHAD